MKPHAPAAAGGWEDVDQTGLGPVRGIKAVVRVSLSVRGRALVRLTVSVSTPVAAALGWTLDSALALQCGTGANEGWLRLVIARGGRPLYHPGRHATGLLASFAPPPDYARSTAPRTVAEHRVDGQALLLRLPWPPAEEEEA